MRTRRMGTKAAVATGAVFVATLAFVAPAGASHVSCGQTITASTTLDGDVGPCPDNGIVIGADGIALDLNGHRVFGTPEAGDGAGVFVAGRRDVQVRNGTVSNFDGGVVIQGGGQNTVMRVVAEDNTGASEGHPPAPGTLYGDGIVIQASSGNSIIDNVARRNGPFSGIGLFERSDSDHPFPSGPAEDNLVAGNLVEDNVECRRNATTGRVFCDNDGIRLEPEVGPGNVITRNVVQRNGLDGISLFGFTTGNTVSNNQVVANGYRGAVPGDGIRVFGFANQIANNTSLDNARDGISVGRRSIATPGSLRPPNGRDNRIVANETGRNGFRDLYDSNIDPPCDNNTWRRNTHQTASPPCAAR